MFIANVEPDGRVDYPVPRHFIVVGAGIGGLATAVRLAHRGHRVTVLEKTDQVGGRNRAVEVEGCRFDGGPTLLMMLDPFRKLFSDVGERFEDHLSIQLCDPSYRVFWNDGTRIDATTNVALMVQRIAETFGREDSLRYPKLLGDLAALYQASIPNFVERNFDGIGGLMGPKQVATVLGSHMTANLAKRIATYVEDSRLRMLFSFQTMYLGLSPYDAPWVYATLTYMEYGEGIWYPEGGMVEIGRAIARLAQKKGVDIRLNSTAASVSGRSVALANGETLEADAVIVNADLPYAERKLLGRPAKNRRYSCSSYVLYLKYKGELPQLLHHNVFFGADFKRNLDQIFHEAALPESPAFYASISARTEQAQSEDGYENLYLLIPCANLDRPWTPEDAAQLRKTVYARLAYEVGFDEANIVAQRETSPSDWSSLLNLDRGAAFGLSHDFLQSAVFRPSNRDPKDDRLFYVGASTVPGNGLPMVLISAQLAEDRLATAGLLD